MEKSRLFVAIDFPKELKEKFYSVENEFKLLINGNFVAKENFHLNLQFIGDAEENKINSIISKLSRIKHKPFELEVENFGAFPSHNYIRVIWIGIKENKSLAELKNKIFPDEKFVPHITLARVKDIYDKTKLQSLLEKKRKFGKTTVDKFHLFKSALNKKGPTYEIIQSFSF